MNYYYDRIQLLLARIAVISMEVHQSNQPFVDHYHASWEAGYVVHMVLAGVHNFVKGLNVDDQLLERFKPYIDGEELKMKKRLQSIAYHIDAPNTLDLVMGSGRMEKVTLIQLVTARCSLTGL